MKCKFQVVAKPDTRACSWQRFSPQAEWIS